MDKARVDGTERQRQRVTVHWSDPEYYQLLRACPLSEPLSVFIRQIVGQWANAHDVPLCDPPRSWYDNPEIGGAEEEEKPGEEANNERTHYQSPKKGGSFHDQV